jgi:ESS family glutamate:Na+ symporter
MTVALAGTILLLGVGWILRRAMPARGALSSIIPAAILGGLVALILRGTSVLPGSVKAWQDVAYHLFGISFLAIGLTPTGDAKLRKGALWMGIGQWATFTLQAAAGGLVVLALGSVHEGFGFLAPMGLNEGPGQALSIGRLWETDYGFAGAASIGATIASVGFLVAYAGGLVAVRKRAVRSERPTGPGPFSGATARFGVAVVGGYAVIYLAVFHGLGAAAPDLRDLVLAVLFFVAMLVGMGVRRLIERSGRTIDGQATRTITVLAVDGLTVAILGSLTWDAVRDVAGPLVLVVVSAVVVTIVVLLVAGRWLTAWRMERSLALFGTVTGTAASGLALLALADPDLESPVSVEMGAMVVVSVPVVLGGIALATATASGAVSLGVATAVFAVVGVLSLAVLGWVVPRVDE